MSHESHGNAGRADMSYIARHEHQRHQDPLITCRTGNDGQFLGYAAWVPKHLEVGFPS